MNERIQELFDKALEEFNAENQYTISVPDPVQTDFVEKFSKLIAKECLMLADNIRNECDVDDEPQQALGAAWVALAITRHFGLEP